MEKELKELIPDIRLEVDDRDESIGKKIREAQMNKSPYMLVLGEKEMKSKKISFRTRAQKDLGAMPLKKFVPKLVKEIQEKK